MEEKIEKGDTNAQVAAKTIRSLIFSKEHTITGVLLIVLGVMLYMVITLLDVHFKKFSGYSKKVDMANTIMIRNNDLMRDVIKMLYKQITISETNNKFLDRNQSKIEDNTQKILINKAVIKETKEEILEKMIKILEGNKEIKEIINK